MSELKRTPLFEVYKDYGAKTIDFPKADLPKPVKDFQPIEISAKSAIVVDVDSAVILYQKNPDLKLPPASTTKIMTAMITFDEYNLDEVVTIDNENFSIGNKSHIKSGEKLSVENLLYALLVSSGNDAALALAQHHPKGYGEFISLMNQKAADLHLTNSQFSNVSGVEQPTHYTTARDLSLLTKEAIKNPVLWNCKGDFTSSPPYRTCPSRRLWHVLSLIKTIQAGNLDSESVRQNPIPPFRHHFYTPVGL